MGGQDAGVGTRRYSIFDEDDDPLAPFASGPDAGARSLDAGTPRAKPADAGTRDASSVLDAARRVQQVRDAGPRAVMTVGDIVVPEKPREGTTYHYTKDPQDQRLMRVYGDTEDRARENAATYTRLREAGQEVPPSLRYRDVAQSAAAPDAGAAVAAPRRAPAPYWALLEDHRGMQHRLEAHSAAEVRRQFNELEARTHREGGQGAYVLVSDGDDASVSGLTSPAYAASMRKRKASADAGVRDGGAAGLRAPPVRARVTDAGAAPPPDAPDMTFSTDEVEPVVAPRRPARTTASDAPDMTFSLDEVEHVVAPSRRPARATPPDAPDVTFSADEVAPVVAPSPRLRERVAPRDSAPDMTFSLDEVEAASSRSPRGARASDAPDMTFSLDEVEAANAPRRNTTSDAPDMTFSLDEVEPVVAPRRDAVARARAIVGGGQSGRTAAPAQEMGPPAARERVVDAGAPARLTATTDAGVGASRAALTDAGAEPVARTAQARQVVAAGPPPPRDAGAVQSLARSVTDPRDPMAQPMQLRASSRQELDRLHEAYLRTREPDAGVAPSYAGLYTAAGKPVQMSATVRAPNGDFVKLIADDTDNLDRYTQFVDRHPGVELTTTGDPYLAGKMREARATGAAAPTTRRPTLDAGAPSMDAGASTTAAADAGSSTTDTVKRAADVLRDASADAARKLPDTVDAADAGRNTYGALEPGNIDLSRRPHVKNADGSTSTVLSMGVEFDGKEYLIPLVHDDGYVMTPEQGIAEFRRTGKHLGVYASPEDSTRAAIAIHEDQEKNPPIDTLAEKDELARVAKAARVVSGNVNRLPDKEPRAELETRPQADPAATPDVPSQESEPLSLDLTLSPADQQRQMLEGEKRIAAEKVKRAEGAAAGQQRIADQYNKIAGQAEEQAQRARAIVEGRQQGPARSGDIEKRMLGLMDSLERHGEQPFDFGHMLLSLLSAVVAIMPRGAAAAQILMSAIPTATSRWADRMAQDEKEFSRLAKLYGLSSHAAATDLEKEGLLAAASAASLRAGLNAIIAGNASEDQKGVARETLEQLNNQTRAHAADLERRQLVESYARAPLAQLREMEARGELGTEGRKILHERTKQGQDEKKGDLDIKKGELDIAEAPARRRAVEVGVAKTQADLDDAPLRTAGLQVGLAKDRVGLAVDSEKRDNADAYARIPVAELKAMEAAGTLGAQGQEVLHERIKREQTERRAELDMLKAEAERRKADAEARAGRRPTEGEMKYDSYVTAARDSYERVAKGLVKNGPPSFSAMTLGHTFASLSAAEQQQRADIHNMLNSVVRGETGAGMREDEFGNRIEQFGLNSIHENVRLNGARALIRAITRYDVRGQLAEIDWDKPAPNAIEENEEARKAASQPPRAKRAEPAEQQQPAPAPAQQPAPLPDRQTGLAPPDSWPRAMDGYKQAESAARRALVERFRRGESVPTVRLYRADNSFFSKVGDQEDIEKGLAAGYTLTPRPAAQTRPIKRGGN